jgi:hypothetical protein
VEPQEVAPVRATRERPAPGREHARAAHAATGAVSAEVPPPPAPETSPVGSAAGAGLAGGAQEALTAETESLGRAFALLESDPAAALSRVEADDQLFSRGQFGAERAFVAFEALRRLGRQEEARARGEALLRRYPRAPQAARVRRALGGSP